MDLMPPPLVLDSSKFIISPMPGAVFSVKVKVGDVVCFAHLNYLI
jgi:biotin carboxyl carrier protein